MAQFTVTFNGSDPSGAELLDTYLTNFQSNVYTGHIGPSRPSYAVAGMVWIDNSTNPWAVKLFDGTNDFIIGYLTSGTTAMRLANFPTPVDGELVVYDNGSTAYVGITPDGVATALSAGAVDYTKIDVSAKPAFLALMSTSQASATGDGTVVTVQFDTEIFDQGGDFNVGTYTFTAPVTDVYSFAASIRMDGVVTANTTGQLRIVTSNRTYTIPFVFNNDSGNGWGKNISVPCVDMDAGDTAYVEATVVGNASANIELDKGGDVQVYFMGKLGL